MRLELTTLSVARWPGCRIGCTTCCQTRPLPGFGIDRSGTGATSTLTASPFYHACVERFPRFDQYSCIKETLLRRPRMRPPGVARATTPRGSSRGRRELVLVGHRHPTETSPASPRARRTPRPIAAPSITIGRERSRRARADRRQNPRLLPIPPALRTGPPGTDQCAYHSPSRNRSRRFPPGRAPRGAPPCSCCSWSLPSPTARRPR